MKKTTKEQLKGSILSVTLEETQAGPLPPYGQGSGEEEASELSLEGYVRVSLVGKGLGRPSSNTTKDTGTETAGTEMSLGNCK